MCVCAVYVRDAYQQATKLGRPPAFFSSFSFLILIREKFLFFVCASRGVFIALGGVAAGGRKHN